MPQSAIQPTRPLPAAEVREGEDHALAVGDAPCAGAPSPSMGEVRGDLDVRQCREAERLDPVARAYESNARSHGPAKRRAVELGSVHSAQVSGDDVRRPPHRPAPKPDPGDAATQAPTSGFGQRLRHARRRPCRRRRPRLRRATADQGLGVATTLGALAALSRSAARRAGACQRDGPRRPGRSALAWRHTFTNRWTAVTVVSTSITQRIGTSSESKAGRSTGG